MSRFSGRNFSADDISIIRQIIDEDPKRSRCKISQLVCEKLGWYKIDGGLKEMSCRVAMLRMQDAGLIKLPSPMKKRPIADIQISDRTNPQMPITQPIHELPEIQIELVDKKTSSLWNEYVQRYHYLGYTSIPGAQLRYIIKINGQIVALLGFGASAWMCEPRDIFIGWSHVKREQNLHLIINNYRFLILPWVQSKNFASKILSKITKRIAQDWLKKYNYAPVLLETFVDIEKFNGGCYKAANWQKLGETKGRGKLGPKEKTLPIKSIFVLPITKNFRKILTG